MSTLPRPVAGLLLAVAVAGCQAPAPQPADAAVVAAPAVPPAVTVSTWRAATLSDLLVGEIAGQRGQLPAALEAYLRQAHERRDPQLAARATRIAWYARDTARVREAATLWAELAPDDPEATANAIVGLLQAGEVEAAVPHLDRALERGRSPLRFNYIVQYALEADAPTRLRVDQALAELSTRHPDIAPLWLARAELAEADEQPARALDFARRARELEPKLAQAVLVEGRLLAATGQDDAARRLLARGARDFPQDRELRLTYLRVLLEQGRGKEARQELERMLQTWPGDGDIALSLALVEWESGDALAGEKRLVALAEAGYRADEAWLYAGRIASSRRAWGLAAAYFQNVRGPQYLAAQMLVAQAWAQDGRLDDALELLAGLRAREPDAASRLYLAESELRQRAGQADQALAVLDAAVAEMPGDEDILYARALAAERVGRLDVVEADLRAMLARSPDNPTALNALGYTLADRTDRLDEAHDYINRALALAPEDPAILDSKGWVLFRLGRVEEAITWLRRAWALSRDGEIAAHLGEALWTAGRKQEARRIWQRALATDPDNRALRATLERLKP